MKHGEGTRAIFMKRKEKIASITTVFALLGGLWTSGPVAGEIVKRFGQAERFNAPPVLDGKLEPERWRSVPALDKFTQTVDGVGPETARTSAYIGYDNKKLFVGIACREPEGLLLQKLIARGTIHSFEESVELFISPSDTKTYYQFMVGASGKRYESKETDSGWTASWASAVHVTSEGYDVEIAVPFTSLNFHPTPGSMWRLNVNRTRGLGEKVEYTCWSNTGGGFHMPNRFGYVVFGRYEEYFIKQWELRTTAALGQIEQLFHDYPESTTALGMLRAQANTVASDLTRKIQARPIDSEDRAIEMFTRSRELDHRLEEVTSKVRLAIIRNEFLK